MAIKKQLYILLGVLAVQTGLYPAIYFFIDRKFGLLGSKSDYVLTNVLWNTAFYTHIIFGGLALLIGWTQFNLKRPSALQKYHRQVGKVYVTASLISSFSGIYIAFYATGGIISSLGFISLAIIWFYTTFTAFLAISRRRVERHRILMTYSYAACFSAVTLRIYLPVLNILFHHTITGYRMVAWLCWIPNLIFAFIRTGKTAERQIVD